jgi:hypothetical protein
MNRFASLLVLTFALPLVAHADEASHKAKAEQMIVTLHLDRMVNGVMQNALQQSAAITNQRYGGKMTPAATTMLSDFQKKLTDVLAPQISWEALKPDYVRMFAETFPEDQLDQMLAFYKTPAGQNLIEKLPPLEQQIGQILQKRVAALQPQVKQMFDDFQKNLPANTPEGAPGAGNPAASPAPSTPPAPTPGKTTPK